jgi:hypothetical protein
MNDDKLLRLVEAAERLGLRESTPQAHQVCSHGFHV